MQRYLRLNDFPAPTMKYGVRFTNGSVGNVEVPWVVLATADLQFDASSCLRNNAVLTENRNEIAETLRLPKEFRNTIRRAHSNKRQASGVRKVHRILVRPLNLPLII